MTLELGNIRRTTISQLQRNNETSSTQKVPHFHSSRATNNPQPPMASPRSMWRPCTKAKKGPYFSRWAEPSSELRESASVDDDAAETDSADEGLNHHSFTVHSGLRSASFDGSGTPNCLADLVILSRPYNKLDICKTKEIEVGTFILRMCALAGWVSLNSGFSSAVYFSEKVH